MKIVKRVLPVLLIVLALAGCDFFDQLKKGVAHTASRINSIQAVGTTWEFAFVDIEYVFTGTGVADEQAVFGREGSDARDTVQIELQGTIYTDVDTLTPNTRYTYTLWLLDGEDLEEYDEVGVKTLPILQVTSPADTIFENTEVEVRWQKLTYEGEDYLKYKVAIYKVDAEDLYEADPTVFLNLVSPLDTATVEIQESDTEGSHTFSIDPQYIAEGYAVTVNTEQGIFDKVSNQSTGIKPFLWLQVP